MKNVKKIIITAGVLVAGWSGSVSAAPYELNIPSLTRPAINAPVADEGGLCICELVNGSWVCIPVGCMGSFSTDTDPVAQLKPTVAPRVLPRDRLRSLRQSISPSRDDRSFVK